MLCPNCNKQLLMGELVSADYTHDQHDGRYVHVQCNRTAKVIGIIKALDSDGAIFFETGTFNIGSRVQKPGGKSGIVIGFRHIDGCPAVASEESVSVEYWTDAVLEGTLPQSQPVASQAQPTDPQTVWLQTYLGKQLRIPEWNHDAITLTETAYVLSGINRFGARTEPYYSVSEHSVRVADCVALLGGTPLDQFIAINHEGDEALLGFDPGSPLLKLLPDLKALKRLAHESYMRRYDLPIELPAIVKHADLVLLATEKRDLMKPAPAQWITLPDPLASKIIPWPNPYARFVKRWRELAANVGFKGVE